MHHNCHFCSKPISNGFAYFSFGAVIDVLVKEREHINNSWMEGFCDIGFHGMQSDMSDSANYSVANDVAGGQMDIHFCSLKCMRAWFCGIIDGLEQELSA